MTKEQIQQILLNAFSGADITIHDLTQKHANHPGAKSSGGGHYLVKIVSNDFAGKPLIERHRMVNGILHNTFKTDIHALALKTMTPEEAKKSR
jgi:BolA family transcriptional regulator, general stress-responsive regulator